MLFDVCSVNRTLFFVSLLGLITVQPGLYLALSHVARGVMFEEDHSLTSELFDFTKFRDYITVNFEAEA